MTTIDEIENLLRPLAEQDVKPERRQAWVTYDEAFAYPASVLAGPGRCCPLFDGDTVDAIRRECAALKLTAPLTDTLAWDGPDAVVLLSGQYNADGGELRPGEQPMRTVIRANADGLFAVGAHWTWQVVEHVCRKCHKVLHRVGGGRWSAHDGTACGADVVGDRAGDPLIGDHEPMA
ncbi:hypothetical protein [Actinoplanes sp. URMC 104]|uniref:hypothetical protein n=1 Tax=Actinoplanes sp. URMC 104 TaxID=3423409 RepID=UPI003F1AA7DD